MQRWSRPLLNTGVSMETINGGLPASRSRAWRITGAARVPPGVVDDLRGTKTVAIPAAMRGVPAGSILRDVSHSMKTDEGRRYTRSSTRSRAIVLARPTVGRVADHRVDGRTLLSLARPCMLQCWFA